MKVGTLEIELLANLARLQKDMNDAKRMVGDATSLIERYATLAKVALASIATASVFREFFLIMKGAIDKMAEFKDMAIDAGVAGAANIQQFERAFRMANVPIGEAVGILQKLSKSSIEVKDPTSNAAQAVAALGLNTAAYAKLKPDEMLIAVAQASAKFAPSAEKNAVMMELMGKSGASMQRVLAEIAQQTPEVSKFINAQAEAADALQDKYTGMQMKAEAFGRAGASVLVPALSNILDGFINLRGEKDGSLGFFEAVSTVMKTAAGAAASLWIGLKDLGDAIGAFIAKNFQTDLASYEAIEKAREERRAKNIAQLSDFYVTLGKVEAAATSAGTATGKINFDPEAAKRAREMAAAQQKLNEQAGELLINQGAKRTALQEELDMNRKLTDGEKLLIEIQRGKYKKYGEGVENALKWEALELDAIQKSIDLRNERIKANQSEVEQRAVEQAAIAKTVSDLEDENDKYAFETSLMALNNKERELAIMLRAKEAALSGDLTDMQRKSIENLYEERRAMIENRAVITDQQGAYKSLLDTLEGGFRAAMQGAKSFGDYIKNGLKNALYELVAKPFIVQISAVLSGGGGGGLNTLTGGGGGGGFGNLVSAGANLFGLGGSTSALAGLGGTVMNGLSTIGLTGTSQFVGGLTGAISGPGLTGAAGAGSSLGGSLAAAGPYIAAALALYAAYKAFAKPGGGPKEEGWFLSNYNSQGVGTLDPRRMYREGSLDPTFSNLGGGLSQSFFAAASRYGAKPTSATFGIGGDTDPRGTAQSRISSVAWVNGREVFYNQNRDIGRDSSRYGAEYELETKRLLAAALQAAIGDSTTTMEPLKKLFADFNVSGSTIESINKLLETAELIKITFDSGIKGLNIESLEAFREGTEELTKTFDRVVGAYGNFSKLFVPEAERNQKLFDSLKDKLKEQNAVLPDTREGYRKLVEGLDLSDESQRALWKTLIDAAGVADAYYNSLGNVSDAMVDVTAELDAMVAGATAAASAIAQALDNIKNIQAFQGQNNATIAGVLQGRPGYNYGNYLQGNVNTARAGYINSLSGSVSDRLAGAGGLRDSLSAQYQYNLQQLQSTQQAQIAAQRTLVSQAQQLGETFKSLGQYGRSLLVGSFSTLSPEAQLAAAGSEYQSLLARARGGDRNAASGLQGASQTYLQQAQGFYGSAGQYASIFNQVQGDLAGFSGLGDQQLELAQSMSTSLETLANTLTPEMIDLQDRFIAELEILNSDSEAWVREQRGIAAAQADIYRQIASSSTQVVTNTEGLRADVRELIGVVRASGNSVGATGSPIRGVQVVEAPIKAFTKAAEAMTDAVSLSEARQKVMASNA